MVPIQEIACLLLLLRKINRSLVVRVHYLKQQHLRALQVSPDSYQDHALGIAYAFLGLFVAAPGMPGEEPDGKKQSHHPRQCPLRRGSEPSAEATALFRQALAKVQPGLLFKDRRWLGNLDRFDALEQSLHALELAAALGAVCQVPADVVFAFGVAVVMQ